MEREGKEEARKRRLRFQKSAHTAITTGWEYLRAQKVIAKLVGTSARGRRKEGERGEQNPLEIFRKGKLGGRVHGYENSAASDA